MPKYLIVFRAVEILQNIVPDAYVEVSGFDRLEITVTLPSDLTPTQISNMKTKLPFVEVTKVE